MKYIKIIAIGFLLFVNFSCQKKKSENNHIIPKPQTVTNSKGYFEFKQDTKIVFDKNDKMVAKTAQLLQNFLKQHFDIELTSTNDITIENNAIFLSNIREFKEEQYKLSVNKNRILIVGGNAGVFYGIQSLMQLIETCDNKNQVTAVEIADEPVHSWRGMHLDVSRHFFSVDFIKKYIDILATHKLNVFHWHLTDDQGWRIEIKKYPKLTEVGAWRKGTGKEEWNYFVELPDSSSEKYGGYYTQEEIKEIVDYAADRFITIVPEIEMPGHSWAALAAYPELSCSGKIWQKPVDASFEFSDPFCAGNEKTFEFLENVLVEVIELFPSEYIHIGGDEAKKTPWENCPKCQQRMADENLEDVEALQSYFIKRIDEFVTSKGRMIIGWDEILEGGLAPGAAVMSWRGEEGGIEAAKAKHDVVMTPGDFLYFNKPQFNNEFENLKMNLLPLEKVYNYNPVSSHLSEDEQQFIKGVQGCLWSEFLYTEEIAENRLMPRVAALSEIAWTKEETKNWADFQTRLNNYYEYLDMLEYRYFIKPPGGLTNDIFTTEKYLVELINPYPNSKIYYTVDGSNPTVESAQYIDPFFLENNTIVKAITKMPSGRTSGILSAEYLKKEFVKSRQLDNPKQGLKLSLIIDQLTSLDQLDKTKKKTAYIVEEIVIPEGAPEDGFVLIFEGFVNILETDVYEFSTTSDDGSRLYLNDQLLVDNDGIQAPTTVSAKVPLHSGFHKIKIEFFDALYGESLKVTMKSSDSEASEIDPKLLFHN